jgi:hypothetical protein
MIFCYSDVDTDLNGALCFDESHDWGRSSSRSLSFLYSFCRFVEITRKKRVRRRKK